MVKNFKFSQLPEIHFGSGSVRKLSELLKNFGSNILLVTGKSSFRNSEWGKRVAADFNTSGINYEIVTVTNEPTTTLVDKAASSYRNNFPDAVISIGGGSTLDAGKAISAIIPVTGKTWDFLEGNPDIKPHPGTKIPFIAVPTTAGTGSEATKNAVLSTTGRDTILKRSLRHDNFVPDIAIIDPELALGCPTEVTAASGLDAITQLLEAYVSTGASVMTDALAYSGLDKAFRSIRKVAGDGNNIEARSEMAYAAMISGIVLSNAGLGAIHGYASVLGGYYEIPHGVVCGTLLGAVTRLNIRKLKFHNSHRSYLNKYIAIGKLVSVDKDKNDEYYLDFLTDLLDEIVDDLKIPRLGQYGLEAVAIPAVAMKTGIKNNPVNLDQNDLEQILNLRL